MESFIPKFINKTVDYQTKEVIEASDYNMLFNLNIAATDNNTELLYALISDPETILIQNSLHALNADTADFASNAGALSNATLQVSTNGMLIDSDAFVPSSKVAKDYMDAAIATQDITNGNIALSLNALNEVDISHGNRLAGLDSLTTQHTATILANATNIIANASLISNIQNKDITQDGSLSGLDNRVTAIELGETPVEILSTLMTKASYAYEGSSSIIDTANKAANILMGANPVAGNLLALNADLVSLNDISFIERGNLAAANSTYYTVSEIRTLKPGAYNVTSAQATALGLSAYAGVLRIYPSNNGSSLEYEYQVAPLTDHLASLFIPSSDNASNLMNTYTYYDMKSITDTNTVNITTLKNNRLLATDVNVGYDMSISRTSRGVTVGYTGPKIVISSTRPSATSGRTTLWIDTGA